MIAQGVMPSGDVSEVEALGGGEMLQQWLLHAQGKLRRSKTLQTGTSQLLQALQQVGQARSCEHLFAKTAKPHICTQRVTKIGVLPDTLLINRCI